MKQKLRGCKKQKNPQLQACISVPILSINDRINRINKDIVDIRGYFTQLQQTTCYPQVPREHLLRQTIVEAIKHTTINLEGVKSQRRHSEWRDNVTIDSTDITRIIRKYYAHLYAYRLHHLDEMHKVFESHKAH